MVKKLWYVLLVVMICLLLGACVNDQVLPTDEAEPQPDEENPAAVEAARQALADLIGAALEDVEILIYETVDWPDACLGLPGSDELCAQVITPGYRVICQYNGEDYEVHTNEDGSQVRMQSPDSVQPPGADAPVEGEEWAAVSIPEAGLDFEIPAGWFRLEPDWQWQATPDDTSLIGVRWADIDPPAEPEAIMLPDNAVMLDRVPVELDWTTAYRYTVEVYAEAEAGDADPQVVSVEHHVLITITGDNGRRVIDCYAAATSADDLAVLEAVLDHMVHSLESPGE
nr:hypothetical protein [Anaerolineae bacterium]